MFCNIFRTAQNVTISGPSDPVFITNRLQRIQENIGDVFEPICLISENLKFCKCWKVCVPGFSMLYSALGNLKNLKFEILKNENWEFDIWVFEMWIKMKFDFGKIGNWKCEQWKFENWEFEHWKIEDFLVRQSPAPLKIPTPTTAPCDVFWFKIHVPMISRKFL